MWKLLFFFILIAFQVNASALEVNLYSARKEILIKPLLDQFTIKTGIKVNLITGGADPLIKRLQIEGEHSPADLFLATDVAHLYRAYQHDLFQKVNSAVLKSSIKPKYWHHQQNWFALSLRARIIVYAPARVSEKELKDYLSLADKRWRQRICIRSSANTYNQSLVASLIAHYGEEKTEKWAQQLVENFARPPTGGDRDQIRAVAAGLCDVAIVNSYYLANMLNSNIETDARAARLVRLFWPAQDQQGTHINISGAGLVRYAKNKENAIKLLEYLVSKAGQRWYTIENHEYPVREDIKVSDILSEWGTFNADNIELERLGVLNKKAVLLMDRVGWK